MMKELVDAYQKALEHEFGALAPLASMLGKCECCCCSCGLISLVFGLVACLTSRPNPS